VGIVVLVNAISEQAFWQMPSRVEERIRGVLPVDGQLVVARALPELVRGIKSAHLVLGWPFPAAMVRSATQLRAVHFFTAGIPESWAQQEKIRVTSQRGLSSRSVAEHALFLLTALLRGMKRSNLTSWNTPRAAERMHASVLGVGGVGSEIVRLIAPLFASVTAVGRGQSATFDPSTSDVVILALPLTSETRALVSADFFAKLTRPGTLLVNVASGALVDEANVLSFLARDPANRYATDVAHPEPYPSHGALFDANEQVLLTPHVGARREDAWDAIEKRALEVLAAEALAQ
jgi:phosphoglycerate dehydrogenase-like enzyme